MGGRDPYSSSKGCAELVTSAYRSSFFGPEGTSDEGVAVASARAGNVIGGGDWSPDRLIPDAYRAAVQRKAVRIRNPKAIRPWQHVLEPLAGYLALAQQLYEGGRTYAEGWNFGPSDEDARPVAEVMDLIVNLWGGGMKWELDVGAHPHEAMLLRLDSSKARSRLGWRPLLPLTTALSWTVDWYKASLQRTSMFDVTMDQIARYSSAMEQS
jgi:CDP-glucose 4,6-dehydratase